MSGCKKKEVIVASVGENLTLSKHGGNQLGVAEALILGKLDYMGLRFAPDIVSPIVLEAARIRLEALGKLTPEFILEVTSKT